MEPGLKTQLIYWREFGTSPDKILEEHAVLMAENETYREDFLEPITPNDRSEEIAGSIRTLYDEKGWTDLPEHTDLVGILNHARSFQAASVHHARLSWISGEPEDESADASSHEWRMGHLPYNHILRAVQNCQTYSRSRMKEEIKKEKEFQQIGVPALYFEMLEAYVDPKATNPPSLFDICLVSATIVIRKCIPDRLMYEVSLLQSRKEIKESYDTLHSTVSDTIRRYTPKPSGIENMNF